MWQIIGSGAIGCLWAANLLRSGQQVHLISREKETLQPLCTKPLVYRDLQGAITHFNCSHSTQLVNNSSPILVCVKAPQVKQALLQHLNNISHDQVIILMHNGMGTAEQVAEILPSNAIICATTANASLLNSPFNITQTGLGITYLGAFNEKALPFCHLATLLNNALGNCHWCDDIKDKLWLKLLINICINPLTAIFQVNNGHLSANNHQQKIKQIIRETAPVLKAEELALGDLLTTVNHVISATAQNYSSMNRDIYFQRLTENEYINGYLLKKASQHNIETPLTESLYTQIKVLENRSLTPLSVE